MKELLLGDWLLLIVGIFFLITGIATFIFGRISANFIEKKMAEEGSLPPIWDKGIGSIGLAYALVIVFPKLTPYIINFKAIRKHTRSKDRILAFFYVISFLIFIVSLFVWGILYSPES